MSLPDYQTMMLPILEYASDGFEHSSREPLESIVKRFGISEDERDTRLPSGGNMLADRMHWSLSYLRQAQLLESTRRGYFRITPRGREVLDSRPQQIDNTFLERYPEFQAFLQRKGRTNTVNGNSPLHEFNDTAARTKVLTQPLTPRQSLETSYGLIRSELADELLEQVRTCSPRFFEQLVVDLLVSMGYGGSRQDAGTVIGKSGDEGIDGIINEDRLGLDTIYIQAKRWEGKVGRPELQRFAGALHGQRARKGIFITTSEFTLDAVSYVKSIDTKIVLIDGKQLTNYMIEHDVGVTLVSTYQIKRVDSDYFDEE